MEISLYDQFRATSEVMRVRRIFALDRLWTQRVEQGGDVSPEDATSLKLVTDQLNELLSGTPDAARWLHTMIRPDPDAFGRALTDHFLRAPVREDERQRWNSRLVDDGAALDMLARAVEELPQRIPEEKAEIAGKIKQATEGGATAGDLSAGAACALVGVGLGGLAATVFLDPIPDPFRAAAAAELVSVAVDAGCFG